MRAENHGYGEDLPATGSAVCPAGGHARPHVPWTNFGNVPSGYRLPLTGQTATESLITGTWK
ncbi:MAG TPA: hypothetical protein VMH35_19175 [Streptosporangiaceae bacterium]|nr:hypothetical protein [Streptosporangiaceae bacterium]